MDVFGAAATALQLAAQCVAALELVERIKSSGKALKAYQTQLQSLNQISRKIAGNPLLQTEEIRCHTESILAVIESQDLTNLLKRGRLYRSWVFICKERSFSEHATALENLKATLILTIQEKHSTTLHEIHAGMSHTPLVSPTNESAGADCFYETNSCVELAPAAETQLRYPMTMTPQRNHDFGDEEISVFSNNTAGRNCDQTNGYYISGATNALLKDPINASGLRYQNNTKEAGPGGVQSNGLHIEHSGDLGSQPRLRGGMWDSNKVVGEPEQGQSSAGGAKMTRQVNGVFVTVADETEDFLLT